MSTIDDLKAVLLEQDGTVSIYGSDKDKEIIGQALAGIEKQLELFAGEVLRLTREVVRLKGTGLWDADNKEFLEGDPVRLDFETVHMEGVVRKAKSGEWELYADDDNHVGLLHNQGRIRKIN